MKRNGEVGRHWLKKWKMAEERLRQAKSRRRSLRARLSAAGRAGRVFSARCALFAVQEEIRLAENAVQKFMTSFATVVRWRMERKR